MDFLSREKIMGLDIDESCVVARELARRGGRFALGRQSTVAKLDELVKDPSLKFKDEGVVINVPTQMVYFRSFAVTPALAKLLKLTNKKSRDKELSTFISRQNLPIKLEECYWSLFVLNESLNLAAARKEILEKYISAAEKLGLRVVGVIPSVAALYNVFIYNYPKAKSRFAFLNIKNTVSDLIIYEAKRLWIYPVSLGSQALKLDPQASEKFSLEIQRAFNSYYLQNPVKDRSALPFYIAGEDLLSILAFSLKKALGDLELLGLDPFKNIILPKDSKVSRQVSTLSLGLGISYFRFPGAIKLNLIQEKIVNEQRLKQIEFFRRISVPLMFFSAALLSAADINLIKALKDESTLYQKSRFYLSKMLPELKLIKAEKEKYQKPLDFLRNKLDRQTQYLKALAVISEGRPEAIEIRDFSAEVKEGKLQALVSGVGPSYAEINEFLNKIKKNEAIKETKIIASSAAGDEGANEPINFKLRFEITVAQVAPAVARGNNSLKGGEKGALKK